MDTFHISSVFLIILLGAISPGPDFAIVVKNSLSGKFRSGFLTTLGISCALLVHVSYCLFGIAVVIVKSPFLFHLLKYCGAGYLFYLGILLLKEKTSPEGGPQTVNTLSKKSKNPFVSGLLCNLLNPKATLFVLSMFTQFITAGASFSEKIVLASLFPLVSLLWFTLLTYLITHRLLQKHFTKFQSIITKTMGVALCLLSLYLIF